jgi:hypothetical protein
MTRSGSPRRARAAKRGRAGASIEAEAGSAGDAPKAKAKFNANGRKVNGIWMASAAQATRYEVLLEMEQAGRVKNLRTEVPYPLDVNGKRIAMYRADFVYDTDTPDPRLERRVVEDVKGMVTPEFKLKAKLFEAIYGDPIRLITQPRNKAEILAIAGEEILAQMHGRSSDFCLWIRLYWSGRVPE